MLGTGVLIRLATEPEREAVEHARRRGGFTLQPERSFRFEPPDRRLMADEAYVVSQAFADFADGDGEHHWVAAEHHGHRVSLVHDFTADLLALASDTWADGAIELLGDMGIGGLRVSRWAFVSAPHRIDLAPELETRLAGLRRT
jgi:hypothetical protein